MNIEKIIDRYLGGGEEYNREELNLIISGYVENTINDDVMTKFLKSIFDNGLSIEKTAMMTDIMMNSGDLIDLSEIKGIKVDKHSTGGVGDKVTIIVAPIVAALGGVVAKMSGRGLGFTGGTLDKLESIPGYQIQLTDKEFINNVNQHKIAIIGQTANIVPADKLIYALRDVTGLIGSLPLIASSIMSKKLATGSDAILLDVKCGDAAFMKDQKSAEELAKVMIGLGKKLGRDVRAEITSMDTPLGKAIGNKNEILEAIKFLKGRSVPRDLKDVIYSSASTMLVMGNVFKGEVEAIEKIDEVIANGLAFEKFKEWIKAQGGDVEAILKSDFWTPAYKHEIKAKKDGHFSVTSAVEFGIVAMKLGAGREKKGDPIDFEAGIELAKKTGESVKTGDLLFTMYSSKPISEENVDQIKKAFEITNQKVVKKIILNKL